LLGRVALQAQFDDGPLIRIQSAQHLLDGLGQDGRMLGRWLPADRFTPGFEFLCARSRRRFPSYVTAAGPVIANLVGALPQGDTGQQGPQLAPVLIAQCRVPIAEKKALVSRLHYVFRFDLMPQPSVQLAPGKADQLTSEVVKHLTDGGVPSGVRARTFVIQGHQHLSTVPPGLNRVGENVNEFLGQSRRSRLFGRLFVRPGLLYCTPLLTELGAAFTLSSRGAAVVRNG